MLMCNSLFAWSLPARLPDRCFGASPVALDVQKHCARAAHPAPHNRTATAPSREHVTRPDRKSSSAMRAQIAEDQRFSRSRKGRRDETPDRLMARPDAEVVEMALPPIVAAGTSSRPCRCCSRRAAPAMAALRALAQRIEVDAKQVRIMGSKSALLRTLVTVSSAKSAGFGVPSIVPKCGAPVQEGDGVACRDGWEPRRYCAAPTGLHVYIPHRRTAPICKGNSGTALSNRVWPCGKPVIAVCKSAPRLGHVVHHPGVEMPFMPMHVLSLVSDTQDAYVQLPGRKSTVTKDGQHEAGPVVCAAGSRSSKRSRPLTASPEQKVPAQTRDSCRCAEEGRCVASVLGDDGSAELVVEPRPDNVALCHNRPVQAERLNDTRSKLRREY